MKRPKAAPGIQSVPKKAEPILESEEEILWEKGLLRSHSPQSLIDTMVFMAGLYFALRSGEEHRQLRFSSVKLVEKPGSTSYLIYTESTSKNNPGGLKHRKVTTKQVTHHANTERPDRCFVEMYKQYCLHWPTDVKDDAFYLAPLSSVKGLVWYKKQAIGVHTLAGTVKRLCVKAGISGYKTNHSLRVTTATRLFHSGLDEQLIMERTGHRSSDGVRAYKRSCVEKQAVVSQVLNRLHVVVRINSYLQKRHCRVLITSSSLRAIWNQIHKASSLHWLHWAPALICVWSLQLHSLAQNLSLKAREKRIILLGFLFLQLHFLIVLELLEVIRL